MKFILSFRFQTLTMLWLAVSTATLLAIATAAFADTRFDEFTKKNATPTEPVRVLSAGLLGGTGTEWLAGGGFQPDGTEEEGVAEEEGVGEEGVVS